MLIFMRLLNNSLIQLLVLIVYLCTNQLFSEKVIRSNWEDSYEIVIKTPNKVEISEKEIEEIFQSKELQEIKQVLQESEKVAEEINVLIDLKNHRYELKEEIDFLSIPNLPEKTKTFLLSKTSILFQMSKSKKIETIKTEESHKYRVFINKILISSDEYQSNKLKKYNELKSTGPPTLLQKIMEQANAKTNY